MGIIETNRGRPLSEMVLADALIHLNSFDVQLRGALDNIAWAFLHCLDLNVDEKNRNFRQKAYIQAKEFQTKVRIHDPALSDYLEKLLRWFDDLTAYRDPIAHRVPIYTPPSTVTQEEVDARKASEKRACDAILSGAPDDEIKEAIANARDVGRYVPYIHREKNAGRTRRAAGSAGKRSWSAL
jgi:hypothetical protein